MTSRILLFLTIISLIFLPRIGISQIELEIEPIPGFNYNDDHEYVTFYATISPKGNRMIVSRTKDGQEGIELVEFIKNDSLWNGPKSLTLINQAQGNLTWKTVASFSSDGTRIFFGAEFQDTYGDQDIYYSDLINGIWQPPVNIGPTVNTVERETFPWLPPSEDRLYFESNLGPPKEEILKIFYSEKEENGTWKGRKQWFENLNFNHIEKPVVFRDNALLIYGRVSKRDDHHVYLSVLKDESSWSVPVQISFSEKSLEKYDHSTHQPRNVTTTPAFEYLYLKMFWGGIYRSKVSEDLRAMVDNAFISNNDKIVSNPSPIAIQSDVIIQKTSENRTALVIGNSNYAKARLKNPVNDAKLLKSELQKAGFKVFVHTDSDLSSMKESIREFGDELRKNPGVGLFYYAGHGLQRNGSNYLVPVDANIQRAYEIEDECLRADLVLRMMETYENPLNIVILDACRNNPYVSEFRSFDRGLAQPQTAPTGSIIAFATAPGKTASDGEGSNGLYTGQLVQVIKTPGLTIEEVFKQVRIRVGDISNKKQIPWENSSLTGDFYFYK